MGDFTSVLAWREALVTDHNCVDVPDIAVSGVQAAFQVVGIAIDNKVAEATVAERKCVYEHFAMCKVSDRPRSVTVTSCRALSCSWVCGGGGAARPCDGRGGESFFFCLRVGGSVNT